MIDAWFFRPAPAARLAVLRILTGVYAVSYVLIRFPVLYSMGDNSDSRLGAGRRAVVDGPSPLR